MPQITVVGSVNADLTVTVARHPSPGETLLAAGGDTTPGGKGANQACAAAKLGAQVALVGAVGRDPNAAVATAELKRAGVDLTHLEEVDDVTGLAVITVADGGENTILVVPGANAAVGAEFVDAHAEAIQAADLLLLQGEIPADGIARAVELARGRVVINLAPVIDIPREVLLRADPLVVNEHEARLLCEQLRIDDSVTALLHTGFASVVVTLGPDGALVADARGVEEVASPDVKTVDTVDTVGAGDAFAGALCHRLTQGDSLVDATRFACRVGAFAVTRPGAQTSYPGEGDALPG